MGRGAKRRRLNPKEVSESEDEELDGSREQLDEEFPLCEESSAEESVDDHDDAIQQELADIDFGTLAKAQKALDKESRLTTNSAAPHPHHRPAKAKLNVKSSSKKSKNAPQEISSKLPVSRKHFLSTIQIQSRQARDPRFDALSSEASNTSFRKAYGFLEEYQRDEIAILKQQIQRSRDGEELQRLSRTLQSLQSRMESREAKDRARQLLKEKKQEEMIKVQQGKRPFYLKKSDQKKLVLADRYDKLGKKKLEKVLEKKRKKREGKEMRKMPRKRSRQSV